jgi:hypothetical protein
MPTMKTLTFAVFMLSTVAFARQATVKVTDVSDKGSPVVVTGSATFEANDDGKTLETVESYEATGMNVSGRNLLAVVVESRGFDFRGPASNYYSVEDYYFKPGIIRAGEAMVVSEAERAPFSQKSPQESKALTPRMEARVLFAQFEDGSTWGDEKSGAELFTTRAKVLEYLKQIDATQDDAAFQGLVEEHHPELSRLEAILHGLRHTYEHEGVQSTRDAVKAKIAVATNRPEARGLLASLLD